MNQAQRHILEPSDPSFYCTISTKSGPGKFTNPRACKQNKTIFFIYNRLYASRAEDASPVPKARNWRKMMASSTMVPREPMSQGRLVMMYSCSVEWKMICAIVSQSKSLFTINLIYVLLRHTWHCLAS